MSYKPQEIYQWVDSFKGRGPILVDTYFAHDDIIVFEWDTSVHSKASMQDIKPFCSLRITQETYPYTSGGYAVGDEVNYRVQPFISNLRIAWILRANLYNRKFDLLKLVHPSYSSPYSNWIDEDEVRLVTPQPTKPQLAIPTVGSSIQCDCSSSDLLWRGHKCGLKARVDQRI